MIVIGGPTVAAKQAEASHCPLGPFPYIETVCSLEVNRSAAGIF